MKNSFLDSWLQKSFDEVFKFDYQQACAEERGLRLLVDLIGPNMPTVAELE